MGQSTNTHGTRHGIEYYYTRDTTWDRVLLYTDTTWDRVLLYTGHDMGQSTNTHGTRHGTEY